MYNRTLSEKDKAEIVAKGKNKSTNVNERGMYVAVKDPRNPTKYIVQNNKTEATVKEQESATILKGVLDQEKTEYLVKLMNTVYPDSTKQWSQIEDQTKISNGKEPPHKEVIEFKDFDENIIECEKKMKGWMTEYFVLNNVKRDCVVTPKTRGGMEITINNHMGCIPKK